MSERVLSHWLLKDGNTYWNGGGWSVDRYSATRFSQKQKVNGKEKYFPVYVTMKKKPCGHSFAWAYKRLMEGKSVRRTAWSSSELCWTLSGTYVCILGSYPIMLGLENMAATDWVLA